MTPETWDRIKELFAEAQQRTPDEQSLWLDQVCADDPLARAEVARLLAADRNADGFLSRPAVAFAEALLPIAAQQTSTVIGRQLGAYRIIREIGRGGMGVVYLAERDDDEYRGRVAIKITQGDFPSQFAIRRLREERQILATLDHPNIARLMDGGTTDDGLPFLVMEYVEGVPIDTYCDTYRLRIRERLVLFCDVCAAVQSAHQRLIIHRDIKPSNVLVTADGRPKLLDFGIARLLDPGAGEAAMTRTIDRALTPESASPEQVRGEPVTTASDVYQLGLLFYRLVTGRRPYRASTTHPLEVARAICEQEPERPSTAVMRSDNIVRNGAAPEQLTPEIVSASREGSPERLRKRLAGDLDTIILKALRKDPARRYATVDQLSEDVRRHLDGLPVEARAESVRYRARKFVARHRIEVTALVLLFLSLIAGLLVTTWQTRVARTERSRAEAQEQANRRLLYAARLNLAGEEWRSSNVRRVIELLDSVVPTATQDDLRGFEWYYLWKSAHAERRSLRHRGPLLSAAISPDGRVVATAGDTDPPDIELWAAGTGIRIATLAGHADAVWSVDFSPDGRSLISASEDKTARLWDLTTRSSTVLRGHKGNVYSAKFSPDGTRVITASSDKTTRLWDLTGKTLATLSGHSGSVTWAAFSSDGARIVTGSVDGTIRVWDATTHRQLEVFDEKRPGFVTAVTFAPDGTRLAATGLRGIAVWDLTRGVLLPRLNSNNSVFTAAFSPDGKILATGALDRTVLLWDVDREQIVNQIRGHGNKLTAVRFSADGKTLLTASYDGTAKLWDPRVEQTATTIVVPGGSAALAFSPNSRHLAFGTPNALTIWNVAEGRAEVTLESARAESIAFSPDGRFVAARTPGGAVRVWDARTWQPVTTLAGSGNEDAVYRPDTIAFTPDGGTLAVTDANHGVRLWTVEGWRSSTLLEGHSKSVAALAFHPKGRLMATASADRTARIWDLVTGRLTRTFRHALEVTWVGFTPDGALLATATRDSIVILHDVATGREVARLGRGGDLGSAKFSPDGRRLVLAGLGDPSLSIFDPATGELLLTLTGHRAPISSVAFSPDGLTIASASNDSTVRLWRAATRQEVAAYQARALSSTRR